MRVSVTIGERNDGSWDVLAMPDKAIEEQKAMVKGLIIGKGILAVKSRRDKDAAPVQFKQVLRFDSYAKRARFM